VPIIDVDDPVFLPRGDMPASIAGWCRAHGVEPPAGPVEGTAIGNALVQARALGFVGGDLEELRALVAATHPPREFRP